MTTQREWLTAVRSPSVHRPASDAVPEALASGAARVRDRGSPFPAAHLVCAQLVERPQVTEPGIEDAPRFDHNAATVTPNPVTLGASAVAAPGATDKAGDTAIADRAETRNQLILDAAAGQSRANRAPTIPVCPLTRLASGMTIGNTRKVCRETACRDPGVGRRERGESVARVRGRNV